MDDFLEPPTHAQRWRNYDPTPEDEAKALEHAKEMASMAGDWHETGRYDAVCIQGEPVFYMDYYKALVPGHIYSDLGMDEFKISRACEYHFDEWFDEPDNDPEY